MKKLLLLGLIATPVMAEDIYSESVVTQMMQQLQAQGAYPVQGYYPTPTVPVYVPSQPGQPVVVIDATQALFPTPQPGETGTHAAIRGAFDRIMLERDGLLPKGRK